MSYDNLSSVSQNVLRLYQQLWHICWRHWRMTSKVRKQTSRYTKNENKRGKFISFSWMLYLSGAPWRRKFSRLNVLFICYGTAVELTSLLNRSSICDGINRRNFQSPKTFKTWTTNITLHWINGIIRNNKCIFTKLNAVFILKTAAWTKKYYDG
jgi:hypothetical protein